MRLACIGDTKTFHPKMQMCKTQMGGLTLTCGLQVLLRVYSRDPAEACRLAARAQLVAAPLPAGLLAHPLRSLASSGTGMPAVATPVQSEGRSRKRTRASGSGATSQAANGASAAADIFSTADDAAGVPCEFELEPFAFAFAFELFSGTVAGGQAVYILMPPCVCALLVP